MRWLPIALFVTFVGCASTAAGADTGTASDVVDATDAIDANEGGTPCDAGVTFVCVGNMTPCGSAGLPPTCRDAVLQCPEGTRRCP